jgi:hypothetical protein
MLSFVVLLPSEVIFRQNGWEIITFDARFLISDEVFAQSVKVNMDAFSRGKSNNKLPREMCK